MRFTQGTLHDQGAPGGDGQHRQRSGGVSGSQESRQRGHDVGRTGTRSGPGDLYLQRVVRIAALHHEVAEVWLGSCKGAATRGGGGALVFSFKRPPLTVCTRVARYTHVRRGLILAHENNFWLSKGHHSPSPAFPLL